MDDSEFIYEIENNLPSEVCKDIIERFEKDPRKFPGLMGLNRLDETIKKSTDLRISLSLEWKDIDNILYNCLKKGLDEYIQYIMNKMSNNINLTIMPFNTQLKDTGYQLQRSSVGGFYVWHHDYRYENNKKRLLTYIWYLNTLNPDDGGTTDFMCDKSVKPIEGKLVFFPATWTYVHRGGIVTNNIKYICTGFLTE